MKEDDAHPRRESCTIVPLEDDCKFRQFYQAKKKGGTDSFRGFCGGAGGEFEPCSRKFRAEMIDDYIEKEGARSTGWRIFDFSGSTSGTFDWSTATRRGDHNSCCFDSPYESPQFWGKELSGGFPFVPS
jgi:hypothetical protein